MSEPQVHSRLVWPNDPENFPLDFHATVSGRSPDDIRSLALDEARNFYGPTLEDTGVQVLSTHVELIPDDEKGYGRYRATIVFRQVGE